MPFTIDVPFKVGDMVWVADPNKHGPFVVEAQVGRIECGDTGVGPYLDIHLYRGGSGTFQRPENEVFLTEDEALRFLRARRIAELEAELAKLREGV